MSDVRDEVLDARTIEAVLHEMKRHRYANKADGSDICAMCGFDLAANCHIRLDEPSQVVDRIRALKTQPAPVSAPDDKDTSEMLRALTLLGWEIKRVSMYDEEGVEGWLWTEPDGTEHMEVGLWCETPPWPDTARQALNSMEKNNDQ